MSELTFNTIAGGVLVYIVPLMVIVLIKLYKEVRRLIKEGEENRKMIELLMAELKVKKEK